jgi:hypothetical protein
VVNAKYVFPDESRGSCVQLIVPLAASRLETLERRRDALIEALGT